MSTSRRAPREEPLASFSCGQERGHVPRSLQSCGEAEEMQKGIRAAPHQLAGNGHPLGALWSLCHDTECGAILGYLNTAGVAVPAPL